MKNIWMTIGLPGIGKSTIVTQLVGSQPAVVISSDGIRKELTGDEANSRKDKQVWRIFYQRFAEALAEAGCDRIVLDATFLNPAHRKSVFDVIRQ